ncbi:MAG: PAS domain-containing protein, partial [Gammaproteobacteria bacterium]
MEATTDSNNSMGNRRLSLKGGWYILIIFLALVPVLFTGVYFAQQFKRTSLHYAAREIALINKEIKDHLEYVIGDVRGILQAERRIFLRDRRQTTLSSATQGVTATGLQRQFYRRFDILGMYDSLITGIYLVDSTTQMLTLWRRDAPPSSASVAHATPGDYLYLVLPLSDTDLAQGMIWAELDVAALWHEESDLVSQEGYASYLLDGEDRVLSGEGQTPWRESTALSEDATPGRHGQSLQAPQLQVLTSASGEMLHGAMVPVAGTDWRILTTVPREYVLAPIYQTFKDVLMVLAVILLLFISLGMRMVKVMLGHISNLLAAFSRAAREDFSPLTLSSVFDECCQIRNGYNRLVSDLTARERERRAAEAALCESERQYRSLVNNIPGAIFRSGYDGQGEILYISDAIETISGYPAQDFLNNAVRSYNSIIHPADVELVREAVERGIEQQESYVVEYRVFGSDEAIRWVYEKGQPVFNEAGAFLWLDGVIFDITSQKLAEQRHQRLLCEYEAIAKAITDVMFTIDVGGELMWYNENLQQISGLSPQRLKGLPVEELFVADRRHDIGMMIANCFE